MRQCYRCWKYLESNPAYILHKKNTKEKYLICDKCKDSKIVTDLIKTKKWEISEDKKNDI